jgi:putative flippase GtrA
MSVHVSDAAAEGRRVGRFAVAGALNTLVGLSVIFAVKLAFAAPEALANAAGYAVGLAVSFSLNRNWVFRSTAPARTALRRFLLVFALAYAVNLGVVLVAVETFGVNGYLAQTLGVGTYAVLFYLGSRRFVFHAAPGDG